MKYKFGSIVTDGSGKLGGQVISRNHYGTYVKTKVTPYNPQSVRQSEVRANQSIVTKSWSLLSDSDRRAWIKESELHPYKDKFGDTRYLSGFGLYTKCNMVRANLNYPLLNVPGPVFGFQNWEVVNAVVYSLNPSIWLFLSPSIQPDNIIQIYSTPVLSPGINYVQGQFRLIGSYGSSQDYPLDLYSNWFDVFGGTLDPGYCIFVKIQIIEIDSGLVSHSAVKKVMILEGYPLSIFTGYSFLSSLVASTNILSLLKAADGNYLASVTNNGAVYRSVDNGLNWVSSGQLFSQTNIYSLLDMGNGVIVGSTHPGGLAIRSTNHGVTFSNIGQIGTLGSALLFVKIPSGVILAGGLTSPNLYHSVDLGLTFTLLSTIVGATILRSIAVLPDRSLLLLANPGTSIYKSSDGGLNWTFIVNLHATGGWNTLLAVEFGIVLAFNTSTRTIFRSSDSGLNWVNLGSYGAAGTIVNGFYAGNGVVLVFFSATARIAVSYDYGLTFTLSSQILTYTAISSALKISDSSFFIGAGSPGAIVINNP